MTNNSTDDTIGEEFQVGEIWESQFGNRYRVTDVYDPIGSEKRLAVLRRVSASGTGLGRRMVREWDLVFGWVRIGKEE